MDDSQRPVTVFLHGLLGNGRNLKTLAKKVTDQSGHSGILLDLRGHGKSYLVGGGWNEPHSFEACVDDVKRSLDGLNIRPHTIVGHSWGGRVALQYAATLGGTPHTALLKQVWLLDTVPGQAHKSVEHVLNAVRNLQQRQSTSLPDRKQLATILAQEFHIEQATAQWLASSYNRQTGDFGFDMNVVEGLWPEFGNQDFYGLIEKCTLEHGIRIDLVRGGKNTGWSVDILRRLDSLKGTNFAVHVLPKAGHWVHVDDLPGLLEVMKN